MGTSGSQSGAASVGRVRVAPAASYSGDTMTGMLPYLSRATDIVLNPGDCYLARSGSSGQSLSALGIDPVTSLLLDGQAVSLGCYDMSVNGTPGPAMWLHDIALAQPLVGDHVIDDNVGLGLALPPTPDGDCWIAVANLTGNAGSVTLRAATVGASCGFISMGNFTYDAAVAYIGGVAALPTDMSSFQIRASSAGPTSIGVLAGPAFPIVGARA